jgi:hypothetical protein
VDDKYKAACFINDYIKNAIAFIIVVQPDDEEQDCTPLQDSNSFYEYRYSIICSLCMMLIACRWDSVEKVVQVRNYPCSCVLFGGGLLSV